MTSEYKVRGFNFLKTAEQGDITEGFEMRSILEIVEQAVLTSDEPCAVYQLTDENDQVIGMLQDILLPPSPHQALLFRAGLSHICFENSLTGTMQFENLGGTYSAYLHRLEDHDAVFNFLEAFFIDNSKMKGPGGLFEVPAPIDNAVAAIDRSDLITLINRVYERCVELDINHFPTRSRALSLRLTKLDDEQLRLELRWVVGQLNAIEQKLALDKQCVPIDQDTLDAVTIAANLVVGRSIAHGMSVSNFESANIKGK